MKTIVYNMVSFLCISLFILSCKKDDTANVDCNVSGLSLTATPANVSCGNKDGSISVTGSGGKSPYQYSIDGNTFKSESNFSGLATGDYTVTIKDANGCTSTATAKIGVDPESISYSTTVQSIIATNCAISGCHVAGTGRPNFTEFSNIHNMANRIKIRTGNKTMPIGRSLTDEQIQQIACWVDAGAPEN